MVHAAVETVALSVVVIGRNEGERLKRCLSSITSNCAGLQLELIYVDSASTDASLETARVMGARALLLDDPKPCAAKARNIGWRAARGQYVLFLDGDTVLESNFVACALHALRDPSLCAVWGHRREIRPEQSIYTRVLDLDWMYPPGPALYFGGDVLVRRCALEQVGGFDPTLNAGEEPEMCARLRARDWSILHIDAPMTRHDLAITTLGAWARRSYRSGIAYAEVAWRMDRMGDPLWQHESRRDLVHGLLYASAPLLGALALWLSPWAAVVLVMAALWILGRTASRARWRTPDRLLAWQYAIHVHLQKLPALAGQMAWRWAHRRRRSLDLVEYKEPAASASTTPAPAASLSGKAVLASLLAPIAWCRRVLMERALRLWAFSRLQSDLGQRLDASNVILGVVSVDGTRDIRIGRGARISAGVHLETQGKGQIIIGDGVVMSAGVHIVAFERVEIGDDAMLGEDSSVRDANHRLGTECTRHSGHDSAAVHIEQNVWIGRGACVLKGVRIGAHSCVGANAVVTRDVPAHSIAVGVPAHASSTPC